MGNLIKQARLAARLSQDELGRAVGVSQQQVGKWERGENLPSTRRLKQLAERLGLEVTALLPSDDHRIEALERSVDLLTQEEMMRLLGSDPTDVWKELQAVKAATDEQLAELRARVEQLEAWRATVDADPDDFGLAAKSDQPIDASQSARARAPDPS